jgi:hypothetical protein
MDKPYHSDFLALHKIKNLSICIINLHKPSQAKSNLHQKNVEKVF